jgi:hypothetical protein
MLPAHEEILSIQLVTNNKYARQVRSCAAGFRTSLIIVFLFYIYNIFTSVFLSSVRSNCKVIYFLKLNRLII